ncbi:MAG: S-methyl-5'-thioinosine phosphorylase [Gammaproteobacteria bacterium]|nr:S-methyl-5'-thioinosine phosphorylase [Gammaproteobacteria bacterium]
MTDLYAVIGGSGLYSLDEEFEIETAELRDTPYGQTSAELQIGKWHGNPVAFLPRHGRDHQIPPHKINYRANLWALQSVGVSHIIAANAVGGIDSRYTPQVLGLPDQIIDYTNNREHTFSDGDNNQVQHVDFSWPYSGTLRDSIKISAQRRDIDLIDGGVYGCSNGPRLESAAEIRKMKADGCSMIGMTGMPEAGLARELSIQYAAIALVVNWCAGIEDREITMDEINHVLHQGVGRIRQLIDETLRQSYS